MPSYWEFRIFVFLAFGVMLWILIRSILFWFISRASRKQLHKTLNDPADRYYLRGYDAMPNAKMKGRRC